MLDRPHGARQLVHSPTGFSQPSDRAEAARIRTGDTATSCITLRTGRGDRSIQAAYPFELDQFQIDAIRIFLDGDSVMVAAPTGTGKTVVAEFGVFESSHRGGKVMYTTPIKALSNQKFRDLRAIYGDEVGLLTGDVTENPRARIMVMTTEVCATCCLQTPWELDAVDCIIFDEVHYIADPERGTTWEEAIILCPDHIQLICLSATVSNAAGDRRLDHAHASAHSADHEFQARCPAGALLLPGSQTALGHRSRWRPGRRLLHTPVARSGAASDQGGFTPKPAADRGDRAAALGDRATLAHREHAPGHLFSFQRRDCEDFAQRFSVMRPNLVRDDADPRAHRHVVSTYLDGLRAEDRELAQVQSIMSLARQGIGFHHAGLLPLLKQLVEVLFSQGLMQVVFATDTLALGVNMPARTVVIGRLASGTAAAADC